MADETITSTLDTEPIGGLSEARIAELLQELGARRLGLREELDRLETWIERLEVELAGRGHGG
jgi:uncharacterized protein YicC (UPF0701 family)